MSEQRGPNTVFVLSSTKKPLMPTRAARARRLLRDGQAAVYRTQPFTIMLKYRADGDTQPVEFKADPGSQTTGIALVGVFPKQGRVVLWAANLAHRGAAIRKRLQARGSLRRGRRGRKTRYRAPRFDNRTRPRGWLAPSLRSRVENVRVWYERLLGRIPITEAHIETVRFDMQALQRPGISGVEYQRGTLAGCEMREYLLEKWERTCAYCGAKDVVLEVEHIVPRSQGGSDRISNLTLACGPCNQRKDNQPVELFLADKPEVLAKLKAQAKAPLRDAAAVNATRYAIGAAIKGYARPTSFWSGGRTKHNRITQDYPKAHWLDAACVGRVGERVIIPEGMRALQIKSTGRGMRQVVRTDRYGFPRAKAGRCKRVQGFQTGDRVELVQPGGKYAGAHSGLLAGVRADGRFDIKAAAGTITAGFQRYRLIQRGDGYAYSFAG